MAMANDTDDGSLNEAEEPLPSRPIPRACEQCRSRKIRCDKKYPCANCQRTKAECRIVPRAPHEKRARVLISSQYERKIDRLDERLDNLTRLIERMGGEKASLSVSERTGPSSTAASPKPSENNLPALKQSVTVGDAGFACKSKRPGSHLPGNIPSAVEGQGSGSLIQGESSLSAQSSFAKNFLAHSIGPNQEHDIGHEMNEELTKLRQIVDAFKRAPAVQELTYQYAMPTPPMPRDDYQLPPIEAAVAFIQSVQSHFWCYGFNELLGSESLSDICLKVYFSNQYTDAQFIILNAALILFTFDADAGDINDITEEGQHGDVKSIAFLCRKNLETAISRLPLFPPATHDTVLALVMSAGYAIDISKPSLAWRLVSTASQISYMLGFHTRSEGTEKSSNTLNKHGRLFWILYLLEKHLSLRLGYSSTIHDRDITLPFPGVTHLSATPAMQYWHNLVKLANIAGRIYEELYSPYALATDPEQRIFHATKLVQEMQQNVIEAQRVTPLWIQNFHDLDQKELVQFTFLADDVLRKSMITFIHRAVPPKQGSGMAFTEECIKSARVALETHEACVATIIDNPRHLAIYFQWTILFAPFIPFIVLFCHVVATGNANDLARMQSFVASVQVASEKSTSVAKLYRLFEIFYNVARRLTVAETNTPEQAQQMRLNSCLLELGFQAQATQIHGHFGDKPREREGMLPSEASNLGLTNQMPEYGTMQWANSDLPLGNWVTLNQQMMDVLGDEELQL